MRLTVELSISARNTKNSKKLYEVPQTRRFLGLFWCVIALVCLYFSKIHHFTHYDILRPNSVRQFYFFLPIKLYSVPYFLASCLCAFQCACWFLKMYKLFGLLFCLFLSIWCTTSQGFNGRPSFISAICRWTNMPVLL